MALVKLKLDNLMKMRKEINQASKKVVTVGILGGATYPNGTKVAEVAKYLEYGWTWKITARQWRWFAVQGINLSHDTVFNSPARPFISATINAKAERWQKFGQRAIKGLNSTNALNKITQALKLMGEVAVQDFQDTIDSGGVGGIKFAERSPLTMLLYGNLTQGKKTDGTGTTSRKQPLKNQGILSGSIIFDIK